jgi:formylglycine-generating enzyme required for sulfatase activity
MAGLEPIYQAKGQVYRSGEFGPEGSNAVTQGASANAYRLPNEAEWEWASRGGVYSRGYKFSGGDFRDNVGWVRINSKGATLDLSNKWFNKDPEQFKNWSPEKKSVLRGCGTWPVGTKPKNELGLYDMTGNVWEWCFDGSPTIYRKVRGDSWAGVAINWNGKPNDRLPYTKTYDIGLRLARSSEN